MSGLYLPCVSQSFFSPASITWRIDLQIKLAKDIIDFFGHGRDLIFKTMKRHSVHGEYIKYIEEKGFENIACTSGPIDEALSENPDFVVLDATSTSLLQVLAQYDGTVFVIVNQEMWKIKPEALALLKKRVVYCESMEEFKARFANIDSMTKSTDTSFMDIYSKRMKSCTLNEFVKELVV